MKQLLFFLIFATVVCSCTITKRHFGPGYHVEWTRKMKSGSGHGELPKIEEVEQEIESDFAFKENIEPDSTGLKQFITEVPEILEEEPVVAHKTFDEPIQSEEKTWVNRKVKTSEKILDEEEPGEEPKRRMHPLMWGIWGMWSIAIACMFFVTFYAEFLIGVALGFFIAMIFAFIVINALRTHPEKYRFRGLSYGFGIPAIVFGTIAFLGFLVFLLGGIPLGPGG